MDSKPLLFPPLLTGRPVDNAYNAAVAAACRDEASAGDFFYTLDASTFAAAVVLEPEVDRVQSSQMLLTAMVAFGDSFGAIGPSELGIFYRWPATFLINAAKAGAARITMPDGIDNQQPEWLVVGIEIAMRTERLHEPGHDLETTTLWDEGCGELSAGALASSYARHFLTWVHTWSEDGFKPVHAAWLARADGLKQEVALSWDGARHKGKFIGLDEHGNMLLNAGGQTHCLSVAGAIETP